MKPKNWSFRKTNKIKSLSGLRNKKRRLKMRKKKKWGHYQFYRIKRIIRAL